MITLTVRLRRFVALAQLGAVNGLVSEAADHLLEGVTVTGSLDIGPVYDDRQGALPDPRDTKSVSGITATTDPQGVATVVFDGPALQAAFAKPQQIGGKRAMAMAGIPVLDLRGVGVSQIITHPVGVLDGTALPIDVGVDPGMVIVGHGDRTSQRLWIRLAAPVPRTHRCIVEYRGRSGALRSVDVRFNRHPTIATVDIYKLTPGERHPFAVVLRPIERSSRPVGIATGLFDTEPADSTGVDFAFGSCHDPHHRDAGPEELNAAWHRLMLSNFDRLILLGDQTYADGIERRFADTPWDRDGLTKKRVLDRGIDQGDLEAAYADTYAASWHHPTVREVLSTQPTYMVGDDHDVVDDFGVIESDEFFPDPGPMQNEFVIPGGPPRVDAAIAAMRVHQQAHGPEGWDGKAWTHFRVGPASYFLANLRVHRSTEVESVPTKVLSPTQLESHVNAIDAPTRRAIGRRLISPIGTTGTVTALDIRNWSPILGMEQWNDFLDWARGDDVSDSDIIVFGSPLPLAWLPIERINDKVKEIVEDKAGFWDNLGGAIIGGLLLGPLGIPLGAVVAEGITSLAAGAIGNWVEDQALSAVKNKYDAEDQWEYRANRIDLSRVLTVLFDLANGIDIDTGKKVRDNKVVVVIAGDTHLGGVHALVSNRSQHRGNKVIGQITSSPLSYTPYDDKLYTDLVLWGEPTIDVMLMDRKYDAQGRPIAKPDPSVKANGVTSGFKIGWPDSGYSAKAYRIVPHRNHGRIRVRRTSRRVRNFRLSFDVVASKDSVSGWIDYEWEEDPFDGPLVDHPEIDDRNIAAGQPADPAPDPHRPIVDHPDVATTAGSDEEPATPRGVRRPRIRGVDVAGRREAAIDSGARPIVIHSEGGDFIVPEEPPPLDEGNLN